MGLLQQIPWNSKTRYYLFWLILKDSTIGFTISFLFGIDGSCMFWNILPWENIGIELIEKEI